ncbi:MAG: LysM peptidoglycan-binding domain-containing protein [Lachnospiraceae bacterium]|nr:LysM peptidoglycan-binding domain-containing protein [Lachnospiraceae bacterium]
MRERTGYYKSKMGRSRVVRRTRWAVIATLALIFCMVTCIFVMNSSAKEEHETYKYYTSIEIQEGDSLWEIAQEYGAVAHIDSRDYIAEVKEINHLQGDEIHSGQYLTIPYYSSIIK